MIFNRSFRLASSKNIITLKQNIIGQHIKVHHFDFEAVERENKITILPHAEDAESVTTLPIVNISLQEKNSKTYLNIETHPRRIDIGGPYILVILCLAAFLGGFLMALYGGETQQTTSKLLMGIGLGVFILFWIKMEFGYFDYVRKLRSWVAGQM
jgi:hypothetical protein